MQDINRRLDRIEARLLAIEGKRGQAPPTVAVPEVPPAVRKRVDEAPAVVPAVTGARSRPPNPDAVLRARRMRVSVAS